MYQFSDSFILIFSSSFGPSGEASRWSVSYKQGLPRLVSLGYETQAKGIKTKKDHLTTAGYIIILLVGKFSKYK